MVLECPLLAKSGGSDHLRATSGLPPTSDIAMFANGLSITGTKTSDVQHMGQYRFEAITAIVGPWDTL